MKIKLFAKEKLLLFGGYLLMLILLFLLGLILNEFDKFMDWSTNLYCVKIALIGISYIAGAELWNIKANKYEDENQIKWTPRVWHKLIKLLLGITISFFLIKDINSQYFSVALFCLNIIFISFFLLLPLSVYFIRLIKNRKDYIILNRYEINLKLAGSKKNFQYEDIQTVENNREIQLKLKNGENYTINNSIVNIEKVELFNSIYSKLSVKKSEINPTNKTSKIAHTPTTVICDNFIICVNYPLLNIELDLVAFALNENDKIISDEHFIFFNNLQSPEKSIENLGDNRINDSDESLKINLSILPETCNSIRIYVTKYVTNGSVQIQNNNFVSNSINDIDFRIFDLKDNSEINKYRIHCDFQVENGVELMILLKENDSWQILFSGKKTKSGLTELVEIYC
jgi:tellurium resistance protein TerD